MRPLCVNLWASEITNAQGPHPDLIAEVTNHKHKEHFLPKHPSRGAWWCRTSFYTSLETTCLHIPSQMPASNEDVHPLYSSKHPLVINVSLLMFPSLVMSDIFLVPCEHFSPWEHHPDPSKLKSMFCWINNSSIDWTSHTILLCAWQWTMILSQEAPTSSASEQTVTIFCIQCGTHLKYDWRYSFRS